MDVTKSKELDTQHWPILTLVEKNGQRGDYENHIYGKVIL